MKSPFSKTRTPVVETKPELPEPAPTPIDRPIAPSRLVESPPAAAPTQLDRIEALLKKCAARLQC